MCKNKIIIKNKRYQPTKKTGYTKETNRVKNRTNKQRDNRPRENAKTLGERLIKEMEVKGQELELQEKRMILDAIQGGVDSMLKLGFLKKKGGK